MCDLCTKHGEGTIWYKNAGNYAGDLLSDLGRRGYIENFLKTTFQEGFETLGRVEAIYRKKGRLPAAVTTAMVARAKQEHYGQVLPIEEIGEVVRKARTVVRMPCACRWSIDKKEERRCYAVSYGPEAWYDSIDMTYFGKASDEGLEALAPDAAVAQMEAMEADGAIHTIWTMMTPFIGAICNCSPRECLAMMTLTRTGVETMERAEFVARVDEARCTGCGLCEAACHFRAVAGHAHGVKRHAHIDPRKCFGCGLCRGACNAGAISLMPR